MRLTANNGGGGRAARRRGQLLVRLALLPALLFVVLGWQSAHAQLSITPTTWNVIGLDSNNVNTGPDTFQAGARVCNTGAATLENVRSEFFWDSANPYINLSGATVIMWRWLAPGACIDFYYPVTVTRTSAAYNTARRYHITVSADGTATFSTPTPRELYVEKLLSQNRNTVSSIIGPTTVYVGQVYNYTINAQTASAYEQLESFLNLSNVTYQVLAVSATYSTPAGSTNDKFYADACGWQSDPTLPNYRSCTGPANYPGGKVGGNVSTTYTVKILGATGTVTAGSLILDFSGNSYHYSSGPSLNITVLPAQLTLSKLASASSTLVGTEITYTLRATNTGGGDLYTLTEFVDTPPTSPAAPTYVAGSSTFDGAVIPDPTQSGGKLTWAGAFTVPAGQSRDLTYKMLMPSAAGAYVNSAVAYIDYTQIDTTPSPTDNAPAASTVNVFAPPSVALQKSCTAPADCTTEDQQPGTDLTFTISFANTGGSAARSFAVTDPLPANTDFKVGSAGADLATTGLTVVIHYSYDDGASYVLTPPSSGGGGAPAGYDRSVTHIRWVFTGDLSPSAPNNAGSVYFVSRIR